MYLSHNVGGQRTLFMAAVLGVLFVTPCVARASTSLQSATPQSLNQVDLTFSSAIDATTTTNDQFSFSPAVAVTSTTTAGNLVHVMTTTQVDGQLYTVTVGPGVRDLDGGGIDPAHNSASYTATAHPTSVEPAATSFALTDVWPQPAKGEFNVSFTLRSGPRHSSSSTIFMGV